MTPRRQLTYNLLIILMIFTSSINAQRSVCDIITKRSNPPNMFFEMNCENRNFTTIWDTYPTKLGSEHSGKFVKIVFDRNNLSTLQPLPSTDASISFSCRHCQTNKIVAKTFADVQQIVRLDLSYNALSQLAFAPDTFSGANIIEMVLSHNQIDILPPELLGSLPLKRLDLSFNRLKVMDQLVLSLAISTLEVLDLSSNELNESHSHYQFNTPALRELYLQNNQLEEVPLSVTALGSTLQSLNVGGNIIERIQLTNFQGMSALRHLQINDSPKLQHVNESALQYFTNLVTLRMRGNPKLESLNLTELVVASHLELIDLSNSSITTLFLNRTSNAIVAFPRLHTLELDGNPWNCDCELYKTLSGMINMASERFESEYNARCHYPYKLSTDFLVDLLVDREVCDISNVRKPNRALPPDLPYYLRPRVIILSVISVLVVVLLGLGIGLLIVCIKTRLRKASSTVDSPIRYTTVRNSQMPPLPDQPFHTI